jgi:uncharacterized lipoprotein YmbA
VKKATAQLWSDPGSLGRAFVALSGAAIFGVVGCSMSGPPPAQYVLGPMPAATPTTLRQGGLPIVELKRVQLPDYLDTTDILERRGSELVPSSTGRWGERLSIGVNRALTASLAARLPRIVVTATPPVERPTWQILVDVAAFEARADHNVVLVAHWSIVDGAHRQIHSAEETSLVEPINGTGDNATVQAMSHALEDLAERLAGAIEKDRRPTMERPTDLIHVRSQTWVYVTRRECGPYLTAALRKGNPRA